MAPTIPSAKLTLSCPLFAADFNPRNSDYLVVGGGGGEGRSGVGNRIALLDTSKRDEITETSEIELSRDEDSVTSMAIAHASEPTTSSTSGGSVIALVGLNSSMAEQKRDNNRHLRSFKIDLARKADEEAKVKKGEYGTEKKTTVRAESSLLSRASLFRTKGAKAGSDTYQRVVRLSPWRRRKGDDGQELDGEETRVAAITTGLAPSGEIVFFQATEKPTESDVIGRIQLGDGEEAEDVDIIDLTLQNNGKGNGKDKSFRVAYTNGVDVFTCQISSGTKANTSPEVDCVYTTPLPEKGAKKSRPKFRALRFLSPAALLLLQNAPDRSGCELVVLELPSPTPNGENKEKKSATVIRRKKLRRTIKIGLGLGVCNLGPSPDTQQHQQQQQSIIAITGSDQSIELLTLDHDPGKDGQQGLGGIKHYITLRDVHPFSVTSISFSNFIPPSSSRTVEPQEQQQQQQQQQQYVKLASVSMGNTVVVHTLPLTHVGGQRYVLSVPETWTTLSGSTALITVVVLLLGVLLQGILEISGGSPTHLGVGKWIPAQVRDIVVAPSSSYQDPLISVSAEPEPEPSATATTTVSVVPNFQRQTLRDIILTRQDADTPSAILVRCSSDDNNKNEIIIETVPPENQDQDNDKGETLLKSWEHLPEDQRALWKQRLIDAGHWTVAEGEAILTGVLFSECCGILGGLGGGEDII